MNRKLSCTALSLLVGFASGCGPNSGENANVGDMPVASPATWRDLNGDGEMEPYEDPSVSVAQRTDDLLSRMTLAQKIHFVSGTGWSPEGRSRGDEKVPGAAGFTFAMSDLGIPSIVLADGPAGLRIQPIRDGEDKTYYATAFPVATLLASTWDADLIRIVGAAMGAEARDYGVDVLLAPGMNIQRNPRGGRNFEYYSEDPFLSGHMAAAMVNGVESTGIGATLKHYVANNQETNRYLLDTIVSERALREIYLRGFQIALNEAHPWAIMSSYNKVNGTPTSQSKALLTTVLRQEWGFQGVVMTDWFAGDDPVAQMQAGNELLMPGTDRQTAVLKEAVENGELDEAALDRNVRYILSLILQSPTFAGYQHDDTPDLKVHADVARDAAAEGIVLLKNAGGTLPLPSDVKVIAAFGDTSYDFLSGGTGSGDVNEAYTVSLVAGLKTSGYVVDPDLQSRYEAFIKEEKAKQPQKRYFFEMLPRLPEMPVSETLVSGKASQTDIALITIGRNSGEFEDRAVEGDFFLTADEKTLIHDVSEAFHANGKRVVLILNVGNVVETASWSGEVDAIVLPWQGGQEAGNALVDVLTGKVNPSGKLPTTFPVDYAEVPSAAYFPGVETSDKLVDLGGMLKAKHARVEYAEGIYVGYRYYDSYGVEPAYEFGYGLSYAHFNYAPVRLSADTFADSITATVLVTNAGEPAGKEVVQLYLAAPEAGGLRKPARELKGFAKTNALAHGESQKIQFTLKPADLASFYPDRSAWIADAGVYKVEIGASSRDIRTTANFKLDHEIVVEKTQANLTPKTELQEIGTRAQSQVGE